MAIRKGFDVYECDWCHKEVTVEPAAGNGPFDVGWRQVRYIGGISKDETDTQTHQFCSLVCTSKWVMVRAHVEEPAGASTYTR
jgi:hypothetical protein